MSQHHPGGRIELTITRHPDGLVSRYLHEHARPGMVLGLSPADGGFTLPEPRPARLLLISGGSGITPVLSMLRTLRDERHPGPVAFLHYARTPADVPYLDELSHPRSTPPNVTVALAYTRSAAGTLRGHLTGDHLAAVAPWHADAPAYVCGPPGLIAAARELFDRDGRTDRLHVENFVPDAVPTTATGAATGGHITFTRSGVRVPNSGDPLLDQAQRAGLRPPFGCRMGICLTCTATKAAGQVRDIRTATVSDPHQAEIQPCVSVPVGDVTLDL